MVGIVWVMLSATAPGVQEEDNDAGTAAVVVIGVSMASCAALDVFVILMQPLQTVVLGY